MKRVGFRSSTFAVACLLILVSPSAKSEELTDEMVQRIEKVLRTACLQIRKGDWSRETWCSVPPFAGAGFVSAASKKSYLGLTTGIPETFLKSATRKTGNWRADVGNEALEATVNSFNLIFPSGLSVLHLGPKEARVTDMNPGPSQKLEAECVIRKIASLRGPDKKGGTLPVSKGLEGFLDAEVGVPGHPLSLVNGKTGFSSKYGNPSRIFSVKDESWGEAFVVVEKVPDGAYVNFYPVRDRQTVEDYSRECPGAKP